MTVAEGLEVRLVAAEPMVRQPVAIEFDDRGRLWVIQYLQYPNPAGLKRVAVDRYSRTVYDRIPEPPPRGPKGADRITILEDTDGDGRADAAHDFVAGLNLASGLAFGYGGVFVLQAPYLLFYPDRDRDDRPDGDPEVLLTGFGMEDAHSVANSLTWGPDGWLYGLQGSTVTARVRGDRVPAGRLALPPAHAAIRAVLRGRRQHVGPRLRPPRPALRQHQRRRVRHAPRRPGGLLLEVVRQARPAAQPLHVRLLRPRPPRRRAAAATWRSAACSTRPTRCPPAWRGRYIAADLLDHSIHGHEVDAARLDLPGPPGGRRPAGQRYLVRPQRPDARPRRRALRRRLARPADGPPRPRRRLGPHQRADLRHHRAGGEARRAARPGPDDPDRRPARRPARSPEHLVSAQGATAAGRAARRGRVRRPAPDRAGRPRGRGARGPLGLLRLSPASTRARSSGCSSTPTRTSAPGPSAWSGTSRRVSARLSARLVELAGSEPDVAVRAQLACTARRLEPGPGLDVAHRLLLRDLDGDDPHLPLLLWWAVEQHAIAGAGARPRPVHGARGLAIGDDPVDDPGPAGAAVRRGGQPGGRGGLRPAARLGPVGGGAAAAPGRAGRGDARAGRRRGRAGPGAGRHRPGGSRPARRDPDPAGGPAREPAGDRAGPGGRRRPPGARAGPPGDARPAGRARGSGGPRPAPRPGDARAIRSAVGPIRRARRARAVRGRVDRLGPAGRLPAARRGLAVAGAGAAPGPGLVGAGLPGGGRPRRACRPRR